MLGQQNRLLEPIPETPLALARMVQSAQFDSDSNVKFETNCYSKCIIIRSLLHEFWIIYWVFLITQRDTDHLSIFELVI